MGKKATTIEEQIQILKDRGMSFSFSEEKVKELLIDIGYYRLGFYWNPFEIDKNHNFKTGSSFENVIKLYYFDVDLRNILTRYLIRIEINFKSKLIYYVSNEYKDLPTWFADESVMNQNFIDGISIYIIQNLSGIIRQLKNTMRNILKTNLLLLGKL
jgi:abortive infection bacteriophage resistance protein